MGDLTRAGVVGAALGTLFGILALWIWGQSGILLFVVCGPFASVLAALPFVAKLPRPARGRAGSRSLILPPRSMIALGLVTMATALMGSLCQLLVRSLVTRELGIAAAGHFHAAWTISMTYLGFVLTAMAADYYPRLAEAIADRDLANRLVNEQTEIALLLAGPAMIAMLALVSWIIPTLYDSQFGDAVSVLRWQVLGDVLKVAAWPMGFLLMARGRALPVLLTELLWMTCYAGLVWLGLPLLGVEATGVAFFASYAVYLTTVFLTVRGLQEFRWTRFNFVWSALLLTSGVIVTGLAIWSPRTSMVVGCLIATGLAVFSFRSITRLEEVKLRLARARDRLLG
jgi:PST family polysaccharide transporter